MAQNQIVHNLYGLCEHIAPPLWVTLIVMITSTQDSTLEAITVMPTQKDWHQMEREHNINV